MRWSWTGLWREGAGLVALEIVAVAISAGIFVLGMVVGYRASPEGEKGVWKGTPYSMRPVIAGCYVSVDSEGQAIWSLIDEGCLERIEEEVRGIRERRGGRP